MPTVGGECPLVPTRRWLTVRPLLLILLVAPFVFGGAAYAMFVAATSPGQARFALSVSPSTQTVTRGGAISFSVKLLRTDGFTGPIKLRVVGLPPWVRARWQTADGVRGAVLGSGQHAAMLTLRAPPRTRPGTRRIRIRATGDGRTVRRTLLLTVARPAQRRFTLIPRPGRRVVNSGATGRFRVRVARAHGFRARVRLRVLGAPPGARVAIRRAALSVTPVAGPYRATHQFVIQGTSRRGRVITRRYAVVVLKVDAPDAIGGNPTRAVYPGSHTPIDLRLTNSHAFKVLVRNLRVSVRPVTSMPGCRGDTDFGVGQYRGPYPLVLRPGTTRLSALVADATLWPQLGMHNLPRNQDACRGARVRLDYSLRLAR